MLKPLALILVLTSFIQPSRAETGPAAIILNAFKGQCPNTTQGMETSFATLDTLNKVVSELKDNAQCGFLESYQTNLLHFKNSYSDYVVYEDYKGQRLKYEREVSKYSMLLADPNLTQTEREFYYDVMLESQSNLVSADSSLSQFETSSSKYSVNSRNLVNSLDSFFINADNNKACFENNAAQVSSLVGHSLVAASTFAGPGDSLVLATTGVIISSASKFLNEFKYNKKFQKIDEIKAIPAVSCFAETMANYYCQTDDVLKLIDTFEREYEELLYEDTEDMFSGVNLLQNDLQNLRHWLNEVHAGSPISNEGDLVNREKPIKGVFFLEKVLRYIQAYKKEALLQLESASGNSFKLRDATSKAISNLFVLMFNPSFPISFSINTSEVNPILDTYDVNLLVYKIFDLDINNTPPECLNEEKINICENFSDFFKKKYPNGISSLDIWFQAFNNANVIVNEVLDQTNIEKAKAVALDAFSILAKAKEEKVDETTPMQALHNIGKVTKGIISKLSSYENDSAYRHIILDIENTKGLTSHVINLVEESSIKRSLNKTTLPVACHGLLPSETISSNDVSDSDDELLMNLSEKSFIITTCISKILNLNKVGTSFYLSKVRQAVSYDINARYNNGEFSEVNEHYLATTLDDLLTSILKSYPGYSKYDQGRENLVKNLTKNKSSLERQYKLFFDYLDKFVEKTLDRDDLNKYELQETCFSSLAYLDEEDQSFFELLYDKCKEVKLMSSKLKGAPVVYWKEFINTKDKRTTFGKKKPEFSLNNTYSFRDRLCSQRDYRRKYFIWKRAKKKLTLMP